MNSQEIQSLKDGISRLIESGAAPEQIRGVLEARGWGEEDISLVLTKPEKRKISSVFNLLTHSFSSTFTHLVALFPVVALTGMLSLVLFLGLILFTKAEGWFAIFGVADSMDLPLVVTTPLFVVGLSAIFLVFGGLQMVAPASLIAAFGSTQTTILQNIRIGFERAYPLLWVMMLTALLVLTGSLLLIVPGLILMSWFYFAPIFVIREGATPFQSLLLSKELVRGYILAVLLRIFVLTIIAILFAVMFVGIVTVPSFVSSFGTTAGLVVAILMAAAIVFLSLFFVMFNFNFYNYFYRELREGKSNITLSPRTGKFLAIWLVVCFVVLAAVAVLFSSQIKQVAERFALNIKDTTSEKEYAEPIHYNDGKFLIAGNELFVAIAESSAERTKGLSGQRDIADNEALLFDFGRSARHAIWMRDMNFSIDIIWLNDEWEVVDIKKDAEPESFRSILDAETFLPIEAASYVVEVAAGFSDRVGLKIGDEMVFIPSEDLTP